MYPGAQLTELALRKEVLRTRIALERAQCTVALTTLTRPLAWADTAVTLWSRLPPLARALVAPLGGVALRWIAPRFFPRHDTLRWGPMVFGVVKRVLHL